MALFVLIGLDKAGGAELRAAVRSEHLAFLESYGDKVKVGGPFMDEAGGSVGSLLVIEVEDRAAAEAIQAADPYAKAGLFASTELRPWRVTAGALA
ncbi:MAG: YciI family protein [Caulobacteraceae bacterium]